MTILALDTALEACSVALYDPARDEILAEWLRVLGRGHAEILFEQIIAVAAEAQIALTSLERFAVTIGPGSFTGVRVGLAAARGLALAAGRPLIGISTFEALLAAHPQAPEERAAVVIDARRSEVYAQGFIGGAPAGPPFAAEAKAAANQLRDRLGGGPISLLGSGAALAAPHLDGAHEIAGAPYPSATHVARAAARKHAPAAPPEPLYLRAPDAKLPGGRSP